MTATILLFIVWVALPLSPLIVSVTRNTWRDYKAGQQLKHLPYVKHRQDGHPLCLCHDCRGANPVGVKYQNIIYLNQLRRLLEGVDLVLAGEAGVETLRMDSDEAHQTIWHETRRGNRGEPTITCPACEDWYRNHPESKS